MVLGRISEGRERLEYSLSLNPLSIRAHRLLGLALTMEGKFEESDRRLKAARELMPDSRELAWMMAAVYLAQGRLEEGLHYARECQIEPAVPRMLAMLGEALARAGRESEGGRFSAAWKKWRSANSSILGRAAACAWRSATVKKLFISWTGALRNDPRWLCSHQSTRC